ncbi:TPA: hypothetical protein I8V98_002542 [Corynebacterium striatum]|nr:hypothetical protein I6J27_02830 [Corynebacterium striatum]HAT1304032.1 hypothetical protein [Corynebacterium striatum]HAT1392722.1 hypothetical protein [Corynebacterium striatum]HCD1916814.1 hypothetical protein [Corynebacterium striatum]
MRKMWRVLQRRGIDSGREHTARLMRSAGLSGKGKGGAPITTRKPKGPDLRPDLVNREFKAPGPNRLWVANITYVRTRKGFVYTVLSLVCTPAGFSGATRVALQWCSPLLSVREMVLVLSAACFNSAHQLAFLRGMSPAS